jgi:hypothetical protein
MSFSWSPTRLETFIMLGAPTAFLAFRSPLALLMVPTLAWRFLSSNIHYWGTLYHYSGILMPIAFAGLIDVLSRRRAHFSGWRLRAVLGVSVGVTAITVPIYPIHEIVMPATWSSPQRVKIAQSLIHAIPDGATVAATNRLSAQLVSRTTVSMVCPFVPPREPVQWMIVDLNDPRTDISRCPGGVEEVVQTSLRTGYQTVQDMNGFVLLKREGIS